MVGSQQRRPSAEGPAVPPAVSAHLAGDDDLLLPRLVARIAELEQQLYGAPQESAGEEGTLLGRFVGALRRAASGVDSVTAFIVGEDEHQAARASQLSKEATAKALLITVNKVQQLKKQKAELEERAAGLQAALDAARAIASEAGEQRAAAASELAAAAAARSGRLEAQLAAATAAAADQAAAAAERAEAAAKRGASLARQLADCTGQLEAVRQQLGEAEQAAATAGARAAAAEERGAALEQQAAAAAEALAAATRRLAEAEEAAAQLQGQLESSREEAGRHAGQLESDLESARGRVAQLQQEVAALSERERGLRAQLAAAAEAAGALGAEADALRAGKAALAQELNETRARLERACATADDFQRRFLHERADRRCLHEQLSELRGNIRVFVRVRPLLAGGVGGGAGGGGGGGQEGPAVSCPLPGGTVMVATGGKRQQEFEFDAAFPGASAQEEVFEEVAPLVRSAADGYNVCIFAYGQTGSGKTHTMMGPSDNPGLSVRALQALFRIMAAEAEEGQARSIQVAMMEVYNEAVRDLLAPRGASGSSSATKLEVSAMGPGQLPPGVDRVPGLTWRAVGGVDEVLAVLEEGTAARATASTSLNAHSSRSHALLSVRLVDGSGQLPTSTLHLVDLAGSERVARSEVKGEQLKEAQAINKSLSALGDVIAALQAKQQHVPYRNSRLTQVLQDSLCGSSKVLLVCCVSPEAVSTPETLSSLTFAQRAAQVEMGPIRRVGEAGRRPGAGSPLPASASPGAALAATGAKSATPLSASRLQRGALRDANNLA